LIYVLLEKKYKNLLYYKCITFVFYIIMDSDKIADNQSDQTSNIKHIVIAGGGAYGFAAYGALKHLHEQGFWDINNIESIHGTSIGAIFGTIISLKYEWAITYNYIINRPWNKVFNFDMYSIINSFQKKGIFDISTIYDIFRPLFGGLDIPMDITMAQLYAITKIDLHLYITNLTDFELMDISHKTFPEWSVIEAVYASAALPILFTPFYKDSKYYLDGGILCNYPIHNCINLGASDDSIIGIYRKSLNAKLDLDDESSMFDYMFLILHKILAKFIPHTYPITTQPQIPIVFNATSLYDIYLCLTSLDERMRILEIGVNIANDFLTNTKTN